jgi:hypothetical protein
MDPRTRVLGEGAGGAPGGVCGLPRPQDAEPTSDPALGESFDYGRQAQISVERLRLEAAKQPAAKSGTK